MDDVARAAGVAKATVCRALQNRPNVAQATREKVLAAVRKLGYQADPSLSALSHRRWSDGVRRSYQQIALVHVDDTYSHERPMPAPAEKYRVSTRAQLFPSIKAKAVALGYHISEYSTAEYKNIEQLVRIVYNRGIDGLLLSIEGPPVDLGFPWEKFSAVSIGLGGSDLPHVTSDWMAAVTVAVETAEKRGYRRIGFINFVHDNPSIDYRVGSAIEYQRQRLQREYQFEIPVLCSTNEGFQPWERWIPVLDKWYRQWKPDAIIDGTLRASHWFETLGVRIPEDLGYVTLFRSNRDYHRHLCSIDHHFELQGEWAVDLLSTMIQSGIKGKSPLSPRLTIPCSWQEGSTLPPRTASQPTSQTIEDTFIASRPQADVG